LGGNSRGAIGAKPGGAFVEGGDRPHATGNCSSLIDFGGPKSWLIFHLLGMSHDQEWLQLLVGFWTFMTDCKNLQAYVSVLKVVNNSAVRGIKILCDFKDM
jgi:hypothetical protein